MSENAHLAPYIASGEELEVLHRRWERGEYALFEEQLRCFLREKRTSIVALLGSDRAATPVDAAKMLVVRLGTVHPPSEMRDQVRAIHDEIWYRGERGAHDRDEVIEHWTRIHAPAWRRWRIKEYLFVLDQIAGEVARHFAESGNPPAAVSEDRAMRSQGDSPVPLSNSKTEQPNKDETD